MSHFRLFEEVRMIKWLGILIKGNVENIEEIQISIAAGNVF
jgi:hypothetical protein